MKPKQLILSFVGLALISGCFYSSTILADESDDIIKYRKNVMKSLAADSRMIKAILTGKISYKKDLTIIASSLAAKAKMVSHHFPDGSDFGDTDAKEEIWENKEDFNQKSKQLETASTDLLNALRQSSNEADITQKYSAVGKSCKACHKKYREK